MANRVRPRLAIVARLAAADAFGALGVCVANACVHHNQAMAESAPAPVVAAPSIESSPEPAAPARHVQVGYASWYGRQFAGRRTASGERFDPSKMTAAHRSLDFGTWVEVTRLDTGRSVRVRITDRGPFGHEDRIIDLSRAAADKLGLLHMGLTKVEVRTVAGP